MRLLTGIWLPSILPTSPTNSLDPSSGQSSSTPLSEFSNQRIGFSLSDFESTVLIMIGDQMGGASCRFWSSLLCVFVSFCLYIITDQMGGASGDFWCSLLCANEQAPRWICNVAEQPHLWMECKGRRTKKVRLEKLTRKTQIQKERERPKR